MIQDVPGSLNISDDIVVFGTDNESHNKALDQVLHKLQDACLTANLEKCEFRKPSIEFFGMIFSEDGVSPDPKEVEDLNKSLEPKNVSELRSFLGMAQYSARIIPDFATVTEPQRILTKKSTERVWGKTQNESFSGS